jgi:hypothetical protein
MVDSEVERRIDVESRSVVVEPMPTTDRRSDVSRAKRDSKELNGGGNFGLSHEKYQPIPSGFRLLRSLVAL